MYSPQILMIRREDIVTMATQYRPVVINVSDYPELSGLSEQEMKDYIRKYAYNMRGSFYNSLGEDIEFSEIAVEQIENEYIDWVFTDEN